MQTMNIRSVLTLSVVGAAIALAATGGIVTGQPTQLSHDAHKTPASASSVEETAKARLAAAERTCKILHDLESGAPCGHQGVEHTYLWSTRRMEAEIAVERTKPSGGDGGLAAMQRHMEWMRDWAKTVADANAKGAFSTFDLASTEFYVAEAEDLLARARAK